MKVAVSAYLGVAIGIAAWAWYVDLTLLHSQREHLLPDIVLFILGMPSSLLLDAIYEQWPHSFTGLAQTGFLTVCALGQSSLLAALVFWRLRDAKA